MKKLMISVLLFFILVSCANTRVNILGVDVTEMSKRDVAVTFAGVAASVATHVAGHYIAGAYFGVEFEQRGLVEHVEDHYLYTDSELRWFARGGFVLQAAVTTVLALTMRDSYFTKGYAVATAAEVITYPIRNEAPYSDLDTIDEFGGSAKQEYLLYSGISIFNLYQTSSKQKSQ